MKLRARLSDLKSELGKVTVSFSTGADPADLEKYKDKDLDLEVKIHRNKRSLDANACFWACIRDLADKLGFDNWGMYLMELEKYGQFVNVKVRSDALDDLRLHWREIVVVGEETVTEDIIGASGYPAEQEVTYYYVNCYYGSHEYNTKEFSHLLDGVIQDMKDLGLDTPPSEDMKRMIEELEKKEKR